MDVAPSLSLMWSTPPAIRSHRSNCGPSRNNFGRRRPRLCRPPPQSYRSRPERDDTSQNLVKAATPRVEAASGGAETIPTLVEIIPNLAELASNTSLLARAERPQSEPERAGSERVQVGRFDILGQPQNTWRPRAWHAIALRKPATPNRRGRSSHVLVLYRDGCWQEARYRQGESVYRQECCETHRAWDSSRSCRKYPASVRRSCGTRVSERGQAWVSDSQAHPSCDAWLAGLGRNRGSGVGRCSIGRVSILHQLSCPPILPGESPLVPMAAPLPRVVVRQSAGARRQGVRG